MGRPLDVGLLVALCFKINHDQIPRVGWFKSEPSPDYDSCGLNVLFPPVHVFV